MLVGGIDGGIHMNIVDGLLVSFVGVVLLFVVGRCFIFLLFLFPFLLSTTSLFSLLHPVGAH